MKLGGGAIPAVVELFTEPVGSTAVEAAGQFFDSKAISTEKAPSAQDFGKGCLRSKTYRGRSGQRPLRDAHHKLRASSFYQ